MIIRRTIFLAAVASAAAHPAIAQFTGPSIQDKQPGVAEDIPSAVCAQVWARSSRSL